MAIATAAAIGVIETSGGVAATSANLVRDPAFLTGTANWTTTAGGSLSIANGHNGHRAIRLLNNSAGAMTLALNDRLNTVATTVAGASYLAGAWVSTDAPGLTAGARMMSTRAPPCTAASRAAPGCAPHPGTTSAPPTPP
ncbi:MAG TPA: hypothetical protein VFU36_14070 [Jatrophihabitans sp.]|nr:hypothetical protein [Jatrophihabitans sp.]